MAWYKDIFSAGIDKTVEAVGKAADELFTSTEEKKKAEILLRKVNVESEKNKTSGNLELERLSIEKEKNYLADVMDAREMHEKKEQKEKDTTLYVLAYIVVIGFFALIITLMVVDLPEGANTYITMLFGALIGGFGQVLNFFFGSSKGSQKKDETIANGMASGKVVE